LRSSAILVGLWLGLAAAPPAAAKVFYSQKEALALAFPGADRVETRTLLLDDGQARAVEQRAQAPLPSRLVRFYTGWKDGAVTGYAVIDQHTVRTQPEAFLVVLEPDGRLRSIRVLAFYEPQEYLPSQRWLRLFEGRRLDERLQLGGDVQGIAGSTLTSRAVTGGVRRALALYEVFVGAPPRTPGEGR
jgi:FMN-binding domain